jgi:Flp pilus assembly protein TadB
MKLRSIVYHFQYDSWMRKSDKKIQSITSAQSGLTADQSARQRRYFISMMIRTACFILTVVLPSPYRWIALAGALTLPYIAVIAANAGRETIKKEAIFNPKRKRLN